jgi:carboxylesterase type B
LIPIPADPFNLTLEIVLVWQPVIDGIDVTNQILINIEKGNYNKVPIMIGTNNNEGVMFVYQVERNLLRFL